MSLPFSAAAYSSSSSSFPIPLTSDLPAAAPVIPWSSLVLGEKLGEGGFGTVFAATWFKEVDDPPLEVAIKLLPIDANVDRQRAFRREIDCVATLRHERLVLIYGICTDARDQAGVLGLVMERCGGNLIDRISGGATSTSTSSSTSSVTTAAPAAAAAPAPLTPPQLEHIARQLLEALVYLHAREPESLVHGDVKPHNTLLASDGNIRLSDFGLTSVARIAHVSYSTQTQAGGGGGGGGGGDSMSPCKHPH